MPFILSDLVVESILRDGLRFMRDSLGTDLDQIEDIFGELKAPHLNKYYGDKELENIRKLVNGKIDIVFGFTLNDTKVPTISINLASDAESEPNAGMSDFFQEVNTPIDPVVIIGSFNADSYNPITGIITLTGSGVNLSQIRTGHIFRDGDKKEFAIIGGITNDITDKHFAIAQGQTINLVGCNIISALKNTRRIDRAVRDNEAVIITCLSEDPLTTKYLYTIVKYFLLSRKLDLISRGLEIPTFDGTDFTRLDHLPSNISARNLTIRSRFVQHSWRGEAVTLLDGLGGAIKVQRDLYPRDDENQMTVQTTF